MGRIEAAEPGFDALAEQGVADLDARRILDDRPGGIAADALERACNTVRVPRELHRGRIGKEFALPADRGLDQVAEERTCIADHHESQSQNSDTAAAFRTPAV